MKRVIFFFSLILLPMLAKSQVYFDLNFGYGLPIGVNKIYYYDEYSDLRRLVDYAYSDNEKILKIKRSSLGQGFKAELLGGVFVSDNFSIDLNLGYSQSLKLKGIIKYQLWGNYVYTTTIMSKYFHVAPLLTWHLNTNGKGQPYISFGPIAAFPKIMIDLTEDDDGDITIQKWVYSGNVALGLKSKLGFEYNVTDKIKFLFTLTAVNMSYGPKKGVLYEYTYNGKNLLDDVTTSEKEIAFFTTRELDKKTTDSEPYPVEIIYYPLNNFSIQLGFRFKL